MGGRGSASGMSSKGKAYGTEYTTLLQSRNIKFVRYNNGAATAPMETMTKGRIYATVDYKDEVKHISFYDNENKRYKQIDLDHYHKVDGNKEKPHTHYGYIHDENGTKKSDINDHTIIDIVKKIWQNREK